MEYAGKDGVPGKEVSGLEMNDEQEIQVDKG